MSGGSSDTATAASMAFEKKYPAVVSELLAALRALKINNPKATRSSVHIYPASLYAPNDRNAKDRRITSWKMTEHMYFKKDNGFPTLARGLFTEQVTSTDQVPPAALATTVKDGESVTERIVARGYDKFFNTDEMAWTSWSAIETHTVPPYHLTLKSNGCLIMIAALSPTEIVVASKHSLGTTIEQSVDGVTAELNSVKLDKKDDKEEQKEKAEDASEEKESRAHAEVGREWVARTLKKSGKTSEQLAKRLWDDNVTAVLELCDDSFEEHVIATPEYWTGLHLHGLNYNRPHFATKTPEEVAEFAKEFGFIMTKHVTLNTVAEVKKFTDEVAKTGSWEGDMIEGFVVRSTVRAVQGEEATQPPYRPGAPFFFKVKFEEPYLLYRQFRETTRALLPILHPKTSPEKEAEIWKRVRSRTRRPEVGVYAEWCGRMMKEEPSLFDNYERGVVRVRERFLTWIEEDGKNTWELAKAGKWRPSATIQAEANKAAKDAERANLPKKYILVPVAVPGCGKTTIGVALQKLFGFAHTQSDDIIAKKTAPTFKRNIVDLLAKNNVVYADRNNHIDKHYTELAGLSDENPFKKKLAPYNVRMIGIVWDIDQRPYHRLLRLCSERIVCRGDNHQTLRPDATMDAEHEAVVSSFLHNFTTPDPTIFDKQIIVSVEDDQRAALDTVVNGLVDILGLTPPTSETIDAALAEALSYKTKTPFHAPARVGKAVRYFGLAPEIDINSVVEEALESPMPEASSSSARSFLNQLREKQRITQKPHITLAHEKNVAAEKEAAGEDAAPGPHAVAWNTCVALAEARLSPFYEFDVTHLAWDDRVMALVVSGIRPRVDKDAEAERAVGLPLVLPEEVEINLHVTVGTQSEEISAFESRGVVRSAREAIKRGVSSGDGGEAVEGGGPVHWVAVGPITGTGRIRGMY